MIRGQVYLGYTMAKIERSEIMSNYIVNKWCAKANVFVKL